LNIKILSATDTHISPNIAVDPSIFLAANESKPDFLVNKSTLKRTISVQYFTTVTKTCQLRWPCSLRPRSAAT